MIKKILLAILIFSVLFIGFISLSVYNHFNVTIFDRPHGLRGKTETIEVQYVRWACDCPDFIETRYYQANPHYEIREEDCIFIEPSNPALEVPDNFYHKAGRKLRLTGRFYKTKGIPKNFEPNNPEKPDKARVFRYDKIEVEGR